MSRVLVPLLLHCGRESTYPRSANSHEPYLALTDTGTSIADSEAKSSLNCASDVGGQDGSIGRELGLG